jgi:replicative DNA helicase
MSTAFRDPPSNVAAEKALLGALMANNSAFSQVAEIVDSSHFYLPVHAVVFESIARLIEMDRKANPVTLQTAIGADPALAEAGGKRYLAQLAGSVVSIYGAADYARTVVDLALRRRLIDFATATTQDAFDPPAGETSAELLDRADAAITTLAGGAAINPDVTLERANALALADWEKADQSERGMGISTGIPALDDAMGTMVAGDLIVFAGATSMGKTALATAVAYNAAVAGNRVGFFSLEMSADQLAGRILTGLSGIPGPRQRRWKLNADQFGTLTDLQKQLAAVPLVIRHAPGIALSQLRAALRRMKRQPGGLKLAVVDYLQIMGQTKGARFENRTREVADITMGLKNLAGEIGIPILLLSQLSRAGATRDSPKPLLSDLRDSGSIEQDADTVVFVWREHYYLTRNYPTQRANETPEHFAARQQAHNARIEMTKGTAELICAKRRHGPTGSAIVKFMDDRAWFEQLEDRGPPEPPPIDMPYRE